jgi:hypothetical protein
MADRRACEAGDGINANYFKLPKWSMALDFRKQTFCFLRGSIIVECRSSRLRQGMLSTEFTLVAATNDKVETEIRTSLLTSTINMPTKQTFMLPKKLQIWRQCETLILHQTGSVPRK